MAYAAATDRGIVRLEIKPGPLDAFLDGLRRASGESPVKDARPFELLVRELDGYFAGRLTVFSVPLDLHGTKFQMRVWRELMKVPYGEVRTYGWLAGKAGNPAGARAAGGALHNNPVPIVVPCHRIVAASGGLGGYGGGIGMKRRLLEIEGSTGGSTGWLRP